MRDNRTVKRSIFALSGILALLAAGAIFNTTQTFGFPGGGEQSNITWWRTQNAIDRDSLCGPEGCCEPIEGTCLEECIVSPTTGELIGTGRICCERFGQCNVLLQN